MQATMAALLRQGARRAGGSVLQRTKAAVASPAVAEERRRLVPRRMHSTDEHAREFKERMAEMLKRHARDIELMDAQADRYDWAQFPLQLAEVANTVLRLFVLYIIGSSCDLLWPFRKDRLEVKEGAQTQTDEKQEQ